MIARGFPVSARLGAQAFNCTNIWTCIRAIAALHQNKASDYIAIVVSIIGVSVPSL